MSEKTELPTVDERCETCRFWTPKDATKPADLRGKCRRLPPQTDLIANLAVLLNLRDMQREDFPYSEDTYTPYDLIPIPGDKANKLTGPLDYEADHRAVWPVTWSEDWCGEWQPRKRPDTTTEG